MPCVRPVSAAGVLDIDVKGYFDSIDWELLLKAVRHHTDCRWVLLYIERCLKVPVQMEDSRVVPRRSGTPQGGVISPLLANLFLHYAFDAWMARKYPHIIPFERYADDIVCHCKSAEAAQALRRALREVPVQMEDSRVVSRRSGTPQGGVISPLLANLFLHYAFDAWMARKYPHIPFERYADDIVCHCKSAEAAQALRRALRHRFEACRLELHPEKKMFVYC